jgi:ATP-dependent Lhr-like helicase
MRADDLLAAVFPAQVQCQDNAPPGELELPDHPLVFETMRDCLTEAMDLDGFKDVLAAIKNGDIEVYARDTVQPSVFAHQILNAMPYAFLDDAPLEERRARAVSLRRALPEDSQELGALDPSAIEQEADNAWPRIRDPFELHDALMALGILPELVVLSGKRGLVAAVAEEWFVQLHQAGRAYRLCHPDGWSAWVAAERLAGARAAYPEAILQHGPWAEPSPALRQGEGPPPALEREDAVLSIVRGWVECSGPFTCNELARTLDLAESEVKLAMVQLETGGMVLRGRFRPGAAEEEFCERRILARVHRATINRLRREAEPVPPATFIRFLFQWQHAEPATRLQGESGLLEIIEALQGFEVAAGALESEVLPTRVADYNHLLLDRLCIGGEVVWGRLACRENGNSLPGRGTLTQTTPISLMLRESLDWVLGQPPSDDVDLPGAQHEVLAFLARRGASFMSDMVTATRRLASDVEGALWLLAADGRVTSDSLEGVRGRINGGSNRRRRAPRMRQRGDRRQAGYSRWSLLEAIRPAPRERDEPRARQLLRRYGVLFPEVLAREPLSPPWRDLVRVLRRLEARGEIRGGRFVSGFMGEQFALPEAVGILRGVKNQAPTGNRVVISACDPLNLAGILTPGERVPAVPGNRLVFIDGVPVCSLEGGLLLNRSGADEATLAQAHSLLRLPPGQRSA